MFITSYNIFALKQHPKYIHVHTQSIWLQTHIRTCTQALKYPPPPPSHFKTSTLTLRRIWPQSSPCCISMETNVLFSTSHSCQTLNTSRVEQLDITVAKSRNSLFFQRKMWVPYIRTKTVYIWWSGVYITVKKILMQHYICFHFPNTFFTIEVYKGQVYVCVCGGGGGALSLTFLAVRSNQWRWIPHFSETFPFILPIPCK